MDEEMAVTEYQPQEEYGIEIRARIEDTYDRVNCETKNYLSAQKSIVKTAEAEIKKAKTFEEKQYWMETMKQSKDEQREDLKFIFLFFTGTIVFYGLYKLCTMKKAG